MLRSTRRGLETWHGRDRVTLADERARQQGTQTSTYTGAPVLDPTCERAVEHPARARSSGSETLSRSRSLVGYTIPLLPLISLGRGEPEDSSPPRGGSRHEVKQFCARFA